MFDKRTYLRRELHEKYGGQRQGGISIPSRYPFIFLFTSDSGRRYGYKDGWTEKGTYLYTGEGQVGDMQFVRGNRAVRDHVRDGKELHLFESIPSRRVRYVGPMVCIGYHETRGIDKRGKDRKIIIFELEPAHKRNA